MKNNWIVKNLEDVCEILDNKRKPISDKVRQNMKGNIPYYGANGQVGWINDFLLDDKLILLAEDGGNYLDPFKPNAYVIEGKAWVNNHAHVIKNKSEIIDFNWLFYVLAWSDIKSYVSGTTRLKLNQTRMREIPIPLPPLQEQKQIVSKIKECFTLLDKSEDKLKKLEQRFSLLNKSALNLLNIPTAKTVKIKDVAKIKGGKRLPKGQKLLDIATNHPYLRVTDFTIGGIKKQGLKYISEDVFKQIKQYTISDKDVFISIAGTIGIAGVVPTSLSGANLTENAAKLTNLDLVNNKYLALILNSPRIQAQIRKETISTTIGKLALFRIAELEIPLPSIEDQNRLVIKVESLLNKNIELRNLINREQLRVQQLRQSILKKAFEGKLI